MKPLCDFWIYENILHNEQVDSARIMDRKLTDQSFFFNLRVLSLSETHIFLEILVSLRVPIVRQDVQPINKQCLVN